MALVGIVILLVKYEVIRLPFLSPGPATYAISPAAAQPAPARSGSDGPEQVSSTDESAADAEEEPVVGDDELPAVNDAEGTEEDVDDADAEGE